MCEAGYTRGVVKLVERVKYSAGVRAEGCSVTNKHYILPPTNPFTRLFTHYH